MNRNHEGYMDKTACEAIRRADRKTRKWNAKKVKAAHLTYQLGEVLSFYETVNLLQR